MRTCEECGRAFSWKQAYAAQWRLTPVECHNCRTKHELSAAARLFFSSAVLAPAVFTGAYTAAFGLLWSLLFAILVMIGASLLAPVFFPFRLTLNSITDHQRK
ncbi:TIGR04104 family putative zinc finger protein [Salisediminibacterium halotolerans]|uniref:Cxxc_20_cxxc protein n=1 Tax=Salisediminibacterium halotolerans TaxID=517425 RepID=A0A1H9U3G6_9BACI|nr:TIGR04104 family putative zinc finger protein [Salisediminibacterium haloalkalitolerans]SES03986.1 cxxc_20_cxxc protein [Salisediminibacterium haloalkalitolerans]